MKAKHADEARKAYTPDQTGKLHAALTGNGSGLVKKDDHKWGALLGLYTGARLREIAQLDVADIRQEGMDLKSNLLHFGKLIAESGENCFFNFKS